MPSSPLDKQIYNAVRAIERAQQRGEDTTGLQAKYNKLMVKKKLNLAERKF